MEMEMLPPVKGCPFCGSEGVALVGSFVRCGNCGATGPFGLTEREAILHWKARSALEQPSGMRLAVERAPE